MRAAQAAGPDAGNVRIGSIDAVLATRHAGTRKLRLCFELVGPAGAPVVFVAGGISAHRHVAANAVDATSGAAVARLRERKRREEKPFAVMFPSLAGIRAVCDVSAVEARALHVPLTYTHGVAK